MCRGLEKSCTEYDRFGFNGKENDKEWGNQLIQDYGFRLYNPAIGKFLSVDPLSPEYPWYTPYQFAGNTPIQAIDLDGLEPDYANRDYYIWKDMDSDEVRSILTNRLRNYDGTGIRAFRQPNIPLTRKMLEKDIEDAADAREWFNLFGDSWASRNFTKYLIGEGGLDIYGVREMNRKNNLGFRRIMKTIKSRISGRIQEELNGNSNSSLTIRVHAAQGQAGNNMNDFKNTFGAIQMLSNVEIDNVTYDENNNPVSFTGIAYYTFFDTYDWGPARRGGGIKYMMGIADHWQLIDLENIGAHIFYSRAYFSSTVSGQISSDGGWNISFGNYHDSGGSKHLEPTDRTNAIPENTETTYDGRTW